MSSVSSKSNKAEQEAEKWQSTLGRAGLTARGVFYVVFGWLALQLALGEGGEGQVSEGSVFAVVKAQAGSFLLGVLTLGLFALTIWMFIRAWTGDPVSGSETKDRVLYAVKGALYGATAVTALITLLGSSGGGGGGGGGGGNSQAQAVGFLFGLPGGVFLVGLIGAGLVAYAAKQFKENALEQEFMSRLRSGEMDRSTREGVEKAGRFGYAGRAIAIAIIGLLTLLAAVQHDPQESQGMGGALVKLSEQPWGPWVLGFVSIGLIGFGLFSVAEAKYRRDH